MFFITANVCVSSLLPVAAAFPIEQAIITRERDARAYVAHTYFMAKVAAPSQNMNVSYTAVRKCHA